MWTETRGSLLALALGAGAASAEVPLSAIDWLTRQGGEATGPPRTALDATTGAQLTRGPPGIEQPGFERLGVEQPGVERPGIEPRSLARPSGLPPPGGVAAAIPTSPVTVTPLGPQGAGAAGVLPPSVTGLPRSLWAGSEPARLARLIEDLPRAGVPAIDGLAQTLMLAEADAPRGAGSAASEAILLARIDQLVERGALDAARALLDRAGTRTVERRRRAFDAALLLGDETAACRAVDVDPRSAADYARRVFCLARGGDWAAGALTLDGARALGALDPVEEALLATFIDEELASGPLPQAPREPSPLAFRLYDALGQPVPTGELPIAYALADLRDVAGWKAQLEASERLARVGAIDGNRLLAIHTERAPSASGGVWDRVAAVQALDAALEAGDARAVAAALRPAWDAMAQSGTIVPLASAFAPRLAGLALEGEAARLALRLALLGPDYEAAARAWPRTGTDGGPEMGPEMGRGIEPEIRALLAVAQGKAPEPDAGAGAAGANGDDVARAVAEGFDGGPAPDRLARLATEDRLGEALLIAVGDVAQAAEGGLDHLPGALRFLRRAGLEDTARRAALQLLILEG